MKKLLSIVLIMLMLATLLASCGESVNTNTDTDTNTENSGNPVLPEPEPEPEPKPEPEPEPEIEYTEKHGNNVYFTYNEKETNYYTEIINYEETEVSVEFPKGDHKSYVKIIPTYEELSTYISTSSINESTFNDNYVVCLRTVFWGGSSWLEDCFKSLGYYDFQLNNEKYEIFLDFYYSSREGVFLDQTRGVTNTIYLIVPKDEINFVEEIQEIVVNQNPINGEHNGMSSLTLMGDPTPPFTNTHWFVDYKSDAILPEKVSSWVVKAGSELEKEIGLISNDESDYSEYKTILYLPNEPNCDFIITEKEIKDGNLYLTVEAYAQHENKYMIENDVKFYDLYIKDSNLLKDNYDVYVTVKKVNIPNDIKIIDKAEAIIIAQEHFFKTYYDDLNGECYYAKKVYSMLDNEDKVVFIPEVENFNLEDVRYIVYIYPDETDSALQLSKYIYYISKTGLILYDVKE